MGSYRVDWVDDSPDDYETEDEYIAAYPDNSCPNCGQPGVGDDCQSCDINKNETIGYTIKIVIKPQHKGV